MLRVASWNVKGVCDSLRQDEVRKLIRNNNISIFGMLETQLRKKFVNGICNDIFDGWLWVSNSVDSPKGCRIAVGWDHRVVDVTLLSQTSQVMHFVVKDSSKNVVTYVSFIYGCNLVKERLVLWSNLVDHKSSVGDQPWVLLGEFNTTLYHNENSNCFNVKSGIGIQEFKDCIDYLGMDDVNMSGLFFTWI